MLEHTTALLIEDFPILSRYYQGVLHNYFAEVVHIDNATDALNAIVTRPAAAPFHLALLHETLIEKGTNHRSDSFTLALELKNRHPDTQLIYSVSRLSTYHIGSIIREINPEGLVFRPDLSEVEFIHAVKSVRSGKFYHSPSIVPHMRYDIATSSMVDRVDRNILHYLSQGARTKDLPHLIALSLPSIEKRKKQLKNLLDDPGSDYQLILAARRRGLI